jgi:hypothetical protein
MRSPVSMLASALGLTGALTGLAYGAFQILQGPALPQELLINSMGAPCVPAESWNACGPAITILPSFMLSGILTMAVSLGMLAWSLFFIERSGAGRVLMVLSGLLLLFGGGLITPIVAFVGGLLADRQHSVLPWSQARLTNRGGRVLAAMWPWVLGLFLAWILGLWVVGYYYNEVLLAAGWLVTLSVVALLALAVFSALAAQVGHQHHHPRHGR